MNSQTKCEIRCSVIDLISIACFYFAFEIVVIFKSSKIFNKKQIYLNVEMTSFERDLANNILKNFKFKHNLFCFQLKNKFKQISL